MSLFLTQMPNYLTIAQTLRRFLSGNLFWRTFLLIVLLIIVSLGAWFQSFRVIEREPRAQRYALQLASIVKLTRAALLYADPALRRALLQDLESNEGVRVFPRESADQIIAPANAIFNRQTELQLRERLGKSTKFAQSVNGLSSVWISFKIDDDDYWVAIDRGRLDTANGWQWFGWGSIALVLSLVGAALITTVVNRPFSRLAKAAHEVGIGNTPEPLPEIGLGLAAETNRSFNQMVRDLENLEADRKLMLAGISHDLRTPLARLRLETEMSPIDETTRAAIINDIEQMDRIIGRFLDYARPSPGSTATIDLARVITEAVAQFKNNNQLDISLYFSDPLYISANPIDIQRIIVNLIDNARKYAISSNNLAAQSTLHSHSLNSPSDINKFAGISLSADQIKFSKPTQNLATLHITGAISGQNIQLRVRDFGPGIADHHLPYITRPFYRVDTARQRTDGIGLGMAIVQRLVKRHHGNLILKNCESPSGLEAIIYFPIAVLNPIASNREN